VLHPFCAACKGKNILLISITYVQGWFVRRVKKSMGNEALLKYCFLSSSPLTMVLNLEDCLVSSCLMQ
jgi:hypothetical protein